MLPRALGAASHTRGGGGGASTPAAGTAAYGGLGATAELCAAPRPQVPRQGRAGLPRRRSTPSPLTAVAPARAASPLLRGLARLSPETRTGPVPMWAEEPDKKKKAFGILNDRKPLSLRC